MGGLPHCFSEVVNSHRLFKLFFFYPTGNLVFNPSLTLRPMCSHLGGRFYQFYYREYVQFFIALCVYCHQPKQMPAVSPVDCFYSLCHICTNPSLKCSLMSIAHK